MRIGDWKGKERKKTVIIDNKGKLTIVNTVGQRYTTLYKCTPTEY